MKSLFESLPRHASRAFYPARHSCVILLLALGFAGLGRAADSGKTFTTPEEAAVALDTAVKGKDSEALRAIFGPLAREFQNPDRVQATNEFETFAAAMAQTNHISRESPTNAVLEVGTNLWPFPIPLVRGAAGWFFDAQAGEEEIQNRRIGRNELETLDVVRAYVEAQREYASADRNGDNVLEFAQKITSSAGLKDGLYWPLDLDGDMSPLGPLVADAQETGYDLGRRKEGDAPAPYHGYYFKILKSQGPHGAAGKYNYVINGHMIAGFALVAWPAEWGQSGIMTFIVNQEGRVYQKDLGPKTSRLGRSMKAYDPDPTWKPSPN